MSQCIDSLDNVQKICEKENYRLIDEEGSGSFKRTYKVEDENGGCFALKIFKTNNFDVRTEREIGAMVKCNHPNIAKIIKIDSYIENVYLVEEFFSGGTLAEKMEISLLNFSEVIKFGEQLISAIEHISLLNLVHRDIKPQNLLFNDDKDSIILTDFGLVRDLNESSLTQSFANFGPCTPLFAAPEQLNNDKSLIDWRTDQFSLAITLAIGFFGYHPFESELKDNLDTINRIANRGKYSEKFKSSVEKLGLFSLSRMLSPWPVERYGNIEILKKEWLSQGGLNNGSISPDGI